MSSSRNWSHNSFEKAVEQFVPFVKLWWMKYMKITPVNYSEWSDTIYVIVEFEMTSEGMEMARDWNSTQQQEITSMITEYIFHSLFVSLSLILIKYRSQIATYIKIMDTPNNSRKLHKIYF